MKRIKPLMVLVLLVLLFGAGFRAVEVLSKNYLFGTDQGWNYTIARDIVENHKLRLIGAESSVGSGVGGIFHGPGYYYLLAVFYVLFHHDPYGGLVFVFASSVVALVLAWVAGKRMLGDRYGLLFAFLFAICTPFVSQGRFLWPPHAATPLVFLVILAVYLSIESKKWYWIPISFLLAGLLYHFHLTLSIPFILALVVYYFIVMRRWSRVIFGSSFAALGISFLPAIVFEIRHGFMSSRAVFSMITGATPGQQGTVTAMQYILAHGEDYWYSVAGAFRFSPFLSDSRLQIFFVILVFWVLWRTYRFMLNREKQILLFFVTLLGVSFVFFAGINNTIWQYYLTNLQIGYMFLFALASKSVQKMSNHLMRRVTGVVFGLCVVLFGISGIMEFRRVYTADYRDYGGTQKIIGKRALLDFVYADAAGHPFGVMIFSPPVYTYPYDYLFEAYGKKKYGFVPYRSGPGTYYLLIEPDFFKSWSYNGWLETVVPAGEVVYTKTLAPSGFIVQKRIIP